MFYPDNNDGFNTPKNARWICLSLSTDCVASLDKGLTIACAPQEVPLGCESRLAPQGRVAANNDKQIERAIITWIKH